MPNTPGYGARDINTSEYGNTPNDDAYTLIKKIKKIPGVNEAAVLREVELFRAECPKTWQGQLNPQGPRKGHFPEVIQEALDQGARHRENIVTAARALGFTELADKLDNKDGVIAQRPTQAVQVADKAQPRPSA